MLKANLNRNVRLIWVAFGVFAALGWSAYRYGMFFDRDFYRLEEIIFVGMIGWILLQTGLRRIGSIPLWTLLPFGICALYALELVLGPASFKGTTDSMLRWMTYACWSLLLWGLWRKPESRTWGWGAIQASGLLLLAGGWAGWYGWTSFTDIVLKFDDAELSATGARLAGFMQYPNAYGAVLAAFLLMQLQLWARNEKHRAYRWVASATVIPYGGALLLTESRGAFVALMLGLGMAFILMDRESRRRFLLICGITAIGSALLAKGAWGTMRAMSANGDEAVQNVTDSGGLWAAALCVLAGALLLIWLHRNWDRNAARWQSRESWESRESGESKESRESKDSEERGVSKESEDSEESKESKESKVWLAVPWLVAGLGAVVACWVIFGNAGERIASHYGTVTSRALFYTDAWEMFKDSPWFGYGGESWRMLFGLYQRQPYVGNEVHSGYIEIALDIGMIGLAMLLFMLAVYVVKIWRHEKAALAPAAVLFVHAAIDFDWSYAFVWLLLIAWFMLHIAPQDEEHKTSPAEADGPSLLALIGRTGLVLLLISSAALGLWAAWRADAAASSYAAASSAAGPAARAAKLRAALDANPAWNRIRLELAPLLPLQERASLLAAGLRYEPLAPPVWLELGIVYAELGDVAQARSSLREALRLERFSREAHNAAIASMASLAARLQADGDSEQAREAAEAAVSMFEQFRSLDREVARMHNPANGKYFQMTTAAKLHAAECLLLLSRTDDAVSLLKEVIIEDNGDWKEQALKLLEGLPNP